MGNLKGGTNKIEEATWRVKRKYAPFRPFIWMCAGLLFILGLSCAVVFIHNQYFTNGEILRTTDRFLYSQGEQIQMTISFPKKAADPAPLETIQPPEVVFALDVSGSMGSNQAGSGYSLYEALKALRGLSKVLLASGVPVGFLPFNHDPGTAVAPTTDINVLTRAWDSHVSGNGGTDIAAALGKSVTLFNADSNRRRFVVLISDGEDESIEKSREIIKSNGYECININEPIPTGGQKILFMGVGLGSAKTNGFFSDVFYYPHQFSCCDAKSSSAMAEAILKAAVEGNFLESLGKSLVLNEFPHTSALSWDSAENLSDTLVPSRWDEETGILEFTYPYLLTDLSLAYTLRVDSIGVHPVAERQAELTFWPDDSHEEKRYSGSSPWVLVLPPWWFFPLALLPSLLYAIFALSRGRFVLADPRQLPEAFAASSSPPVERTMFRRNSLEPLKPEGEDHLIPTAVVAVGPGGAKMLSALLANRAEVGLGRQSDKFRSFYLDCRDKANLETEIKEYNFCKINLDDEYLQIPPVGNITPLITDIRENPQAHPQTKSWFRAEDYRGHTGVAQGCGGDRTLARLALYQDMLSDDSGLEKLKDNLDKWMKIRLSEHPQIILLADPDDELSVWLPDIGFHLRQQFGPTSIPIHLIFGDMLDAYYDPSWSDNKKAMLMELKTLQGASGWPWLGLMGSSVTLPLFDRVICLKADGEQRNPHPMAAAAMVMEFMDVGPERRCQDEMDDQALYARAAVTRDMDINSQQGSFSFLTTVEATVLTAPIWKWCQEISCWAMRDFMNSWLGYESLGANTVPLCGKDDPKDIWEDIRQAGLASPPKTLAFWDAVLADRPIEPAFSNFEPEELRGELLLLLAAYLNGKRLGSALRFTKYLSEKPELSDMVSKTIQPVWESLNSWQKTFVGDGTVEGQNLAIAYQLSNKLAQLEKFEENNLQSPGRVALPSNAISHDNQAWYKDKLCQKISEEAPARILWVPDAIGSGFELLFKGFRDIRLTLKQVRQGRLQYLLFDLAEKYLAPEMSRWSLESCIKNDEFAKIAAYFPPQQPGRNSLLFHGLHSENRIHELEKTFQRQGCAFHGYSDRVTLMALSELLQNNDFRINTSIKEAAKIVGSLVHPQTKLPARLFAFAQNARIADLENYDLGAVSKLLTQNDNILLRAMIVWAGQMIQIRPDSIGHYLEFSNFKLSHAEDVDMEKALLRLLLLRLDRDGNTIEPDKIIFGYWDGLSPHEKKEVLEKRTAEVNQPADWEYLMLWKAKMEMSQYSQGGN